MLPEGPDNANKRIKKDIFQSTFSPENAGLRPVGQSPDRVLTYPVT